MIGDCERPELTEDEQKERTVLRMGVIAANSVTRSQMQCVSDALNVFFKSIEATSNVRVVFYER
jgi:hypothetical protein